MAAQEAEFRDCRCRRVSGLAHSWYAALANSKVDVARYHTRPNATTCNSLAVAELFLFPWPQLLISQGGLTAFIFFLMTYPPVYAPRAVFLLLLLLLLVSRGLANNCRLFSKIMNLAGTIIMAEARVKVEADLFQKARTPSGMRSS